MPLLFFLVFIAAPVLELWVLIEVGSEIGALATIALLILTAIAGIALIRLQGLLTLVRATQRMNSGELPAQEMGEGILLGAAGLLLLLPGFVSDGLAVLLLIPPLRRWLLGRLMQRMTVVHGGNPHYRPGPPPGGPERHTIEGEYRRED